MSTCPSCGSETPEGVTCIVCGHAPGGDAPVGDDVAADAAGEPEAVDPDGSDATDATDATDGGDATDGAEPLAAWPSRAETPGPDTTVADESPAPPDPDLVETSGPDTTVVGASPTSTGNDRGDEVGAGSGAGEQWVAGTPALVGARSTRVGDPGGRVGSGSAGGPPPPGTPPTGTSGTPPPAPPPMAPPMAGAQPVPPRPGALPVTESERNWGMLSHLSSLVAAGIGGLAFLGPLVVWLIKKDESRFVRHHAVEALNFNLSLMIYAILAIMVGITVVGLVVAVPAAIVGFILWFVTSIVAAVKAQRGEAYRYPLTMRLVRE